MFAVYKAFPGDLIRMVLSLLRESEGPLSTKQITLHVMAARGIDTADKQAFELFGSEQAQCCGIIGRKD
jgi:hypothetical protein